MVEAGQGFVWLRGIEQGPSSIGRPDALARYSWDEMGAPSPASALRAPVASVAATQVQGVGPEVAQFDGTGRRALELWAPVVTIAGTELKGFVPGIAVFDGTDRNHIRDALKEAIAFFYESALLDKGEIKRTHIRDALKEALSLFGESASFDKGEIKSGSAMRANVMSLTMPPTPFTRRSYANSIGHFLFLDSGACRNMVFDPALLINWRAPPTGTYQFVAADGVRLDVIGYGDIEMENFRIPGVYLVRGLTVNLISVGDLARSHKICCSFAGNECNLMLADGRQIGGAIRRDDNQYLLRFLEVE